MIKKEDVFKIGQFAKPHGIKGEITLLTTSDVFDDSDDPFIVCEFEGILVPFFIEEYRYKSDSSILVKLENIDSELQAREFSNLEVYYPLDAAVGDLVGDMTWDSFVENANTPVNKRLTAFGRYGIIKSGTKRAKAYTVT